MQKKQPAAKDSINGAEKSLSKKIASSEGRSYDSYIDALKKSEERYSLAQRAANIGSWDWDILTGALSWSDTIDTLFGFKKGGGFKKTYGAFIECVHPDDRKSVSSAINACLQQGKGYEIEHRVVWPNGAVHWLLEKGDAIKDKRGRTVRMLAIVQDITERKRKDEEIEMLSRFPSENPSPVMRIAYNGKILFANSASRGILKKWEAKVGDNVPDNIYKTIRVVSSSKKRKDIELEIESRIFSCILMPIKGSDYLNFYARDITGRKKAEEGLKQEKEFSESILKTMPDGMSIVDENRVIVHTNKAFQDIFGKGAIGRKCHEAYKENKKPCELCHLVGSLKPGETKTAEVSGITGNRTFLISHTGVMLNGKNYTLEIFKDITTRKKFEEELKTEKEFSESILKTIPGGLDIVDENLRIVHMNTAFQNIFGKGSIGSKCYEVYKDDKMQCERCPLSSPINPGETKTIEVSGIANGKIFLISHTVIMLHGKRHILEVFNDITDYRKIEHKFLNLSRAVDQSHASIVITDTEGTILYVNPYFTQSTGYTWDEAIGQNPRIMKSGKQPQSVYKEMWDTIKSGKDWQGEFCNKKKNNELYWERVSVSPVKDDAGNINRFVAVKEDITKHKLMEDALHRSSERYRSYIEVTGQLGWTANAKGEVTEDIPSWREYTSQTYGEVKGFGWSKAIHPDDLKHTLKAWKKAVKEKSSYEAECRIRRYDGIYRNFVARGVPMFRKDGNILEWIGTCIDITEIKENEGKLRQSRERYLLAQRAANIGSWDWDMLTGALHWSEQIEPLFGFKRGQFGATYEAFLNCVHPDDRKLLTDSVNACLEKNIEYNIEHRIVWPDGSMHWVLERGDVIRDKDNKPVRMLGIVQDITQRKLVGEENIKSLKEKEVLLKEVHHRVKNNLQLVSSMLNLQFRNEKDRKYVEAIKESKNRIRSIALIHEKLYRSKDFSSIDIASYIHELTSSLLSSYSDKSRGISLKINCDKIFIDVNTAIPCGLIINELVINSLKHAFPTEKKGTIEISCIDKNDSFILAVKDDGIGLPEKSHLQNTNSIGLQLVSTLAEQLEATVNVDGTKGTSFEIAVPKKRREG